MLGSYEAGVAVATNSLGDVFITGETAGNLNGIAKESPAGKGVFRERHTGGWKTHGDGRTYQKPSMTTHSPLMKGAELQPLKIKGWAPRSPSFYSVFLGATLENNATLYRTEKHCRPQKKTNNRRKSYKKNQDFGTFSPMFCLTLKMILHWGCVGGRRVLNPTPLIINQESHIDPWPRYFWKVSRYTSHLYHDTFAKVCLFLAERSICTTNLYHDTAPICIAILLQKY